MWTRTNSKILFLVLATIGIAAAHFLVNTGSQGLHVIHILLAGLSLLVIGAGALWYGWRGGVTTAAVTTVLYLIHMALDWPHQPMENANQLAFAAIFIFVGAVTGVLSDLETREVAKRIEAERGSQRNAIIRSLSALDQALGLRNGGTLTHSENVARLATQIARQMGLADERIEELRLAALAHDIGKIGVRDDILLKPGKLDPQELAVMRRHPETAAAILSSIPGAARIAEIVLSHHERLDGNGYPRGLVGDQITMETRILSVADAYCALREKRPYKDAIEEAPVWKWLEEGAGTAFDTKVLQTLSALEGP